MTYALVDNATLTAVQRLAGQVLTKSNDSVDTDIVALENVVQAILFYDQLLAIDDYIPKYRDIRIDAFPFIRFLNCKAFNIEPIKDLANKKSAEIRPQIRGGEFANEEFKILTELLKTHILCTWDIQSSIYYLTLKVMAPKDSIEFQKYGNLVASIFSELADASETGSRTRGNVELVDRFGTIIKKNYKVPGAKWGDGTTGGTKKDITLFIAALSWLANRSIFYSLTANYIQADTFLYPIRQAYQQYYISKTCGYGHNFTKRIVERFSKSLSRDLIDIQEAGLATSTAIDLPVFSAWLAKQTGDVAQIVNAALQLKNEQEFVEAREQLRSIRKSFDEDDIGKANKQAKKVIVDINNLSAHVRKKYFIKTSQGVPVTRLIQVFNTVSAVAGLPPVPELSFLNVDVPLPSFLKNAGKKSGFGALYRNIASDLSTVWALGEARDILGARVVKDRNAFVHNPKNEAPEFRYAHSPFKSPM